MNIETKFDINEEIVNDLPNHPNRGEIGKVQEIYATVGSKGGHRDGVEYLVQYPHGHEFFISEEYLMTVDEFEEVNQQRFENQIARSAG